MFNAFKHEKRNNNDMINKNHSVGQDRYKKKKQENKMYTYGVTFASAEIPSMLILNLWIMIPCATFALKKYEVTVI